MPLKLPVLALTCALGVCGSAVAQDRTVVKTANNPRTCPFIVSPSRPSDSRGETVYEVQGDDQLNIPAVPGACVLPVRVSTPTLKFPKELRESKHSASVEVIAVVTPQGDVIDARASDTAEPNAAVAATDAAMQFKFKPATLDGKPVAVVVKIPFNFILKKFLGFGRYPQTP